MSYHVMLQLLIPGQTCIKSADHRQGHHGTQQTIHQLLDDHNIDIYTPINSHENIPSR